MEKSNTNNQFNPYLNQNNPIDTSSFSKEEQNLIANKFIEKIFEGYHKIKRENNFFKQTLENISTQIITIDEEHSLEGKTLADDPTFKQELGKIFEQMTSKTMDLFRQTIYPYLKEKNISTLHELSEAVNALAVNPSNFSKFNKKTLEELQIIDRKFTTECMPKIISLSDDLQSEMTLLFHKNVTFSNDELSSEDDDSSSEEPSFDFKDVTKYLPNKTELLNKKLPANYAEEVLTLLEDGNWKDFANHDMENFAYQTLQLANQDRIGPTEFTTCMFYWALRQKHPAEEIQVVPLFENGKINPMAKKAMMETIDSTNASNTDFKEEHIDTMLEQMRYAPPSEQFFFSIKGIEPPTSESLKNTITQQIQQSTGINLFTTYHDNNRSPQRMIVSLSIMQEFLNAFAGPQAVQIIPRIKESSIDDIKENGRNNTRDMGIPFYDVTLPDKADEFAAPNSEDFWMHDFYHALICSCAPTEHRQLFINLADKLASNQIIKDTSEDDKGVHTLIQEFINRIIDMEVHLYRPHKKAENNQTDEDCFVTTLISKMVESVQGLAIKKANSDKINPELTYLENVFVAKKIEKNQLMNHIAKICLEEKWLTTPLVKQAIHRSALVIRDHAKNYGPVISRHLKEIITAEPKKTSYFWEFNEGVETLKEKKKMLEQFCETEGHEWMEKENMIQNSLAVSLIIQLDELLNSETHG